MPRWPDLRRRPQRHDLIFVKPAAWSGLLSGRRDLQREPIVATWAERRLPLMARRLSPGEGAGLAVRLPLPHQLGLRPFTTVLRRRDVVDHAAPPPLREAIDFAPAAWRSCLSALIDIADQRRMEARVSGCLAWRLLTGLDYVSRNSELGWLLPLPAVPDLRSITREIHSIEHRAPIPLNGEFVRIDGAAVSWRELHRGAAEVLVETTRQIALHPADRFISGGALR